MFANDSFQNYEGLIECLKVPSKRFWTKVSDLSKRAERMTCSFILPPGRVAALKSFASDRRFPIPKDADLRGRVRRM